MKNAGSITGRYPALAERQFSAGDFKVPQRYLSLLAGPESATLLLTRAGIPETHDARATLPSITFLNLCLEHMRAMGDESYGVAPAPVPRGAFGLLMAAASQGDTFGDALVRFADAAKLLRPDLVMRAQRSRARGQITITSGQPRTARTEFMIEIFAVTMQCAFRWLTGRRLRPLHVRVAEPMPAFERSVLSVFGCPTPQNGTGVTLCYAPQDLEAPLLPVKYQHWAAHELGEFMRLLEETAKDIQAPPLRQGALITAKIAELVAAGVTTEPAAAAALGMSTASLRRRLAEAGSSFRNALSEAQRDAAASLLATDTSLADIAAEIGFSDARSLRRACQRWFGMTPAEYRRSHLPTRT